MILYCECGGQLKAEEGMVEEAEKILVRCEACAKPQSIDLEMWEGLTKMKGESNE